MEPNVRLEHALIATETDSAIHVMLELAAPEAPTDTERPPLALALVLDRSGSMTGEKLETTKACAAWLVDRLSSSDQVAIVTYDNEVDLVAPLQSPSRDLLPWIGGIYAGGSTNLSGGWLKGVEVLRAAAPEATRRVLLLTDGQANAGITDRASLVAMATEARGAGIGTSTIGFGADFDEVLLTGISDAGGGNGHFAEGAGAAPGIFSQEFEGLASLVAQNVSVEVRPSPEVQLLGLLNHYPATPVAGGVQLALGDAYGGERRTLIFELYVPGVAALGVTKVADLVLRCVSVGEQIEAHEVTVPVVVNVVTAEEAAAAEADHRVTEEVVILKAAQARDEAQRLAGTGDFEAARLVLESAAAELRRLASGSEESADLLVEAGKLEATTEELNAVRYSAMTSKRMHYDAMSSRRKRRP